MNELDTMGTTPVWPEMNWNSFWSGLVIGLVLMLLFWPGCACRASEQARNMEDIHAASCRVFAVDQSGRGAIGTGTICGLFDGRYYVLTNWHVVESHRQVTLQFFGNGRVTECKAAVAATWHNEQQPYDFAILTVEQRHLAEYDPPFVPLAQRGTRPKTGGLIMSSGCSEGRWPFAWKGSVESYYGETAQFFPAPKGGQSGSAIVENIDGQLCITGILTWRVGDEKSLSEEEMRGGAIPISKLYEAFDGKQKTGLPNSVPPYSVWCNAGNADVSSASSESGVSPDSSPKKEAKNESKPVKEEPKEEAIKRVDPKEKPENDKDHAIYRVEPKTETVPKDMPTHKKTEKPKVHAIGNTDEFKHPVSQNTVVEVVEFTSAYCQPCQQAQPIVAQLQKEGRVIHVVQIDNDEGRKMAYERNVTGVPTFIAYRSTDGKITWDELSRFTGVANLRERLLQMFSRGNSGGNSQRTDPRPVKPDTDSIAPLFSAYGSGWRRDKPDAPDPLPGTDEGASGIFRSNRGPVLKLFHAFLIGVTWRAAILIAVFWFVMYAALKGVDTLAGHLPKVSLQFGRQASTVRKNECAQ